MTSQHQTAQKTADVLNQLEPVARSYVQRLLQQNGTPISQMPVDQARAYMRGNQRTPMEHPSVEVKSTEMATVRVRVVRPAGRDGDLPVVLYLHGGGWVLGAPETHGRIVQKLACMADANIIVPDYALAPENPYPAALDQCYAIAQQISTARPGSGLDSRRLAVAGDSAGGNLAAALALRAVHQGDVQFRLQALLCPAVQAYSTTGSYRSFGTALNLTADTMQWFWQAYVPDKTLWNQPAVSPLKATRESLARVAPAWIVTAGCDVLRDEAEQYGERLVAAGNPATVLRCMATIHNFLIIDDLDQSGPAIAATAALGKALWNALHTPADGFNAAQHENERNAQAWP